MEARVRIGHIPDTCRPCPPLIKLIGYEHRGDAVVVGGASIGKHTHTVSLVVLRVYIVSSKHRTQSCPHPVYNEGLCVCMRVCMCLKLPAPPTPTSSSRCSETINLISGGDKPTCVKIASDPFACSIHPVYHEKQCVCMCVCGCLPLPAPHISSASSRCS